MTVRALQAGDRIRVGGGCDYKVEWMAAVRGEFGYPGTVVEFIPGQNQQRAAVIELDEELVLPHGAGEGRGRELRGLGTRTRACGNGQGDATTTNRR